MSTTISRTSSFEFINVNPSGVKTCDCVIRAISLATGKSWEEVFDDLAAIARKRHRMPNDPPIYSSYLKTLGWEKQKAPRHDGNYRFKARDFCKIIDSTAICHIGGHHLSVIKDHKVHDIWDCSEGSVGNYWIKVR